MERKNARGRFEVRFFSAGFALILAAFIWAVASPALSADRLVVEDGSGKAVFNVQDNGGVTSDGISFPVSKIIRTTSQTTAGRGVAAFELKSTGNMVNGFGPSFEFWISDNGHTASKGIVTLEAVRDGGDQNGKLEILTASGGSLNYRMSIASNGYVGIGNRNPSYPLQMGSGAYVSTGGVWINASSRAYKQDIKSLTREDAAKTLTALEPVQFSYKADPEEQHIGFIAEDVPDLVASKDRKGMSAMDVVAVLTKVVQDQQKTIEELSKKVAALEQK
ncbi:MAG: tail fiber domain-containing protein [Deltaproteobacteria bacterium]|nr:tail fiber domain-containing protein [Deltaproteobacteria bacterium]